MYHAAIPRRVYETFANLNKSEYEATLAGMADHRADLLEEGAS
jgi:hypothetical protein